MDNNDVLRMFRYALNIPDPTMIKVFTLAKCKIDKPQLLKLLKKKGDSEYVQCSTTLLGHFFDGLIIYNRGNLLDSADFDADTDGELVDLGKEQRISLQYQSSKNIQKSPESLSNNVILKKIRIALDLKQDDMMEIFRLGKVTVSKGEFTAMFRKEGHKNYKDCGDQYMKKFLQGLAVRHRM